MTHTHHKRVSKLWINKLSKVCYMPQRNKNESARACTCACVCGWLAATTRSSTNEVQHHTCTVHDKHQSKREHLQCSHAYTHRTRHSSNSWYVSKWTQQQFNGKCASL